MKKKPNIEPQTQTPDLSIDERIKKLEEQSVIIGQLVSATNNIASAVEKLEMRVSDTKSITNVVEKLDLRAQLLETKIKDGFANLAKGIVEEVVQLEKEK